MSKIKQLFDRSEVVDFTKQTPVVLQQAAREYFLSLNENFREKLLNHPDVVGLQVRLSRQNFGTFIRDTYQIGSEVYILENDGVNAQWKFRNQ